jgi:hypothetical protein
METKPIRAFLESLPEPARTQAYNNIIEGADLDEHVESMSEALGRTFDTPDGDFDDTREGFAYWYAIITEADHDYQIRLHQERGLNYDHLLTPKV